MDLIKQNPNNLIFIFSDTRTCLIYSKNYNYIKQLK